MEFILIIGFIIVFILVVGTIAKTAVGELLNLNQSNNNKIVTHIIKLKRGWFRDPDDKIGVEGEIAVRLDNMTLYIHDGEKWRVIAKGEDLPSEELLRKNNVKTEPDSQIEA